MLVIWLTPPSCALLGALLTNDVRMLGVWVVMVVIYLALAGMMGMFSPTDKDDVIRIDLSTPPEKRTARTRDEERKHQAALYWRRRHDDESEE